MEIRQYKHTNKSENNNLISTTSEKERLIYIFIIFGKHTIIIIFLAIIFSLGSRKHFV